MIELNVADCRVVTFHDDPEIRLLWFDDEQPLGTCRVEGYYCNWWIWDFSYRRQASFLDTITKYSERAKNIVKEIAKGIER